MGCWLFIGAMAMPGSGWFNEPGKYESVKIEGEPSSRLPTPVQCEKCQGRVGATGEWGGGALPETEGGKVTSKTKNRWGYLRQVTGLALGLVLAMGIVACDDGVTDVEEIAADEAYLEAMEETIQDEYRAELIYQGVLDDFGSVRPFSNIINAEVRHSEAIGILYTDRGLQVPTSRWNFSDIPSFSSVTEACQAGVQAEIDNAAIYGRYFDMELPEDVRRVFENNQAASLDRHLPAFEFCS